MSAVPHAEMHRLMAVYMTRTGLLEALRHSHHPYFKLGERASLVDWLTRYSLLSKQPPVWAVNLANAVWQAAFLESRLEYNRRPLRAMMGDPW